MGLLQNILNTVKRHTLDRTDLDERAMNTVKTVANKSRNFFTQTLPIADKVNSANIPFVPKIPTPNYMKQAGERQKAVGTYLRDEYIYNPKTNTLFPTLKRNIESMTDPGVAAKEYQEGKISREEMLNRVSKIDNVTLGLAIPGGGRSSVIKAQNLANPQIAERQAGKLADIIGKNTEKAITKRLTDLKNVKPEVATVMEKLKARFGLTKPIGQSLKTAEELVTKKPPVYDWNRLTTEKRLSPKQADTVKRVAEAMSNSSRSFDPERGVEAISRSIRNVPESELDTVLKKVDFSKPNSFKPFWDDLAKRRKLPTWKIIEQEADASLIQGPKTGPKIEPIKPVQQAQPKKLAEVLKTEEPSPENIGRAADELNTFTPKAKVTNKNQAVEEINKTLSHHSKVGQQIKALAQKNGIPEEDLTDVLQGIKPAPEGFKKVVESVRKYTDNLRNFRENPSLGYQEKYLQHIKRDELAEAVNKINLDANLWLPENVLDLGSTKARTGALQETHLKDFNYVWERMGQEAGYDKYKNALHNTPEKVAFIEKIKDRVRPDKSGNLKPPSSDFNFIEESAKANKVVEKKVIKTKVVKGIETFNALLDNVNREDEVLGSAMRSVRDGWREYNFNVERAASLTGDDFAKVVINELKLAPNRGPYIAKIFNAQKTPQDKTRFAENLLRGTIKTKIQNFIDTVGNYKFDPSTEKFLNEQIDRLVKVNQYSDSLYNKAVNLVTGLAYRAQIWGNVAVALQQKLETFRLPALYGPKITLQAIKQRAFDKFKGRDIVKTYGFKENDFTKIQTMFSGAKRNENILTKIDDQVGKVGNFMVKIMEDSKNADFLTAAEIAGKGRGLQGKALRDYVRDELFTNGYILDKFNTPEILQKSAIGRLALQYQQYMIKDFRRIVESYTMEKNAPLTVKLLGAKLAQILFWAGITGAGWESVRRGTVGLGVNLGPGITVPYEAGKIIRDMELEKERERTDPEYQGDYAEIYGPKRLKDIAKRNVVPFGVQLSKSGKALENIEKGYAETAGGRITYKVSDNPIVKTQSAIFGPSVDKEAREYYRKEGGVLADIGITKGTPKYTSINETRSNYIKGLFKEGKVAEGRKAIDDEHITQDIRKQTQASLTETEKKKMAEFYPVQKRDKEGNVIPDFDTQAQTAHAKWKNPELVAKLTEEAKEISKQTGKPLNPFYSLSPEQQQTVLRIQTLPPGNKDKKDLQNLNIEWLADYWKDQGDYDKATKAVGLRSENPYYDAQRIKISPELQILLDVYNTLPKGTGERSRFLKAYPSVLEFFNANEELTNVKRLYLGLPVLEDGGGSGFQQWPKKEKDYLASMFREFAKGKTSLKKLFNYGKTSQIKAPVGLDRILKSKKEKLPEPKVKK